MTAINVVRCQANSAHVVTDGIIVDAAGNVFGAMSKVATFPHLNAAVAVNGSPILFNFVGSVLSFAGRSFDDLATNAADTIRTHIRNDGPKLTSMFGKNVLQGNVVIAGWSESRGPHAFLFPTFDGMPGMKAFEAVEIPGMYYTPSSTEIDRDFADMNTTFSDSRAVDLVTRQRELVVPSIGNWKTPIVGGFVQVTTIKRDSITSRILHRWNEPIGEPIKVAA